MHLHMGVYVHTHTHTHTHTHALTYLNTAFIIAQLKPRTPFLIVFAVRPLLHLLKNCLCLIYVKPYLINSIMYNEL